MAVFIRILLVLATLANLYFTSVPYWFAMHNFVVLLPIYLGLSIYIALASDAAFTKIRTVFFATLAINSCLFLIMLILRYT